MPEEEVQRQAAEQRWFMREDHPWLEMPAEDSLDETVRYSLDEIRYA